MASSILLVEDDEILRETLTYNLQQVGYEVAEAADGTVALDMARSRPFDLIILDIMLPALDGLSVCRILRAETTLPILMLTARTSEVDKIVGLDSGADDYVTKPFSMGELLARVRTLLRRVNQQSSTSLTLERGDLWLDLARRRASHQGQELLLSPKEFDLLAELMRQPGVVLSRDLLLDRVWGYDFMGDTRTVDVHVRWLREKIEEDPSSPQRIQTVRGIGYRFSE